ncbi:MAG: oligosaccharide flippase family protein [Acutalibacteraceae bacterium]
MKKRVFVKNAAVLTVTAIILRTAGMLLRIYLSQTIGAEGMGLYQLIISIYMLASTFASSGLSTAVTRLVTDELVCGDRRSVRRVLRRAIELTVIIGAIITAAIYFFADFIATYWIKDIRAVPALKILSFSLCFMGISSCIKGYFMARRRAAMPSTAQIFEQTVRIVSVVLLIGHFGNDITRACFAILLSDTIAESCSCLYLFICYLIDRRRVSVAAHSKKTGHITARLIKISAPIVAGRYLNSILRTIENLAVPDCLNKYGGSKEAALAQFGELKGMALPIIFFPSSFLMSMSTLLIPEMSEARALGDNRSIKAQVSRAVGITIQMSVLISAFFMLLSNQIGVLVYNSEDVGFLIKVLSPLIPAMYLESVCDGMLKGLNQQNHSLCYSAVDSVLRIAFILVLVPRYGMAGFLFMMVLSNLFTSSMNVGRLLKISKAKFDIVNWVLKPVLFIIIGGAVSYGLLSPLKLNMICYCLLTVLIVTPIYCVLMLITKSCKPVNELIIKMKDQRRRKKCK